MPHRYFSAPLLALLLFPTALAALAQEENLPPQVVSPSANAPFSPPTTLAAGFKNMEWRAVQRGPLFAVNPQTVRQWRPKRDPHLPYDAPQPKLEPLGPPDGPRNSYRAETLASFFGRKLTRVGSVTVFAPTEMTVLATGLTAPADPMAGLSRDEKISLLQASLSDAQWKQMGSPNGLGVGEMDATQRELFLSLLPDPFIVTQYKIGKNGNMDFSGATPGQPPVKTTLIGGERQQIRLRMNRSTRMTIPSTNDKNGGWGEYVTTQAENQIISQVSHPNEYNVPDAFGVMLRDTVPARLKPGQLEWATPALDAEVDLRGTKTVGELIARIAKATGLEITADARVAQLPLWVYGDPIPTAPAPKNAKPAAEAAPPPEAVNTDPAPARAGDALKALCWAVTGTLRKVGPVYLLTDDLEGIGTRQARISRWVAEGNRRKQLLLTKYEDAIRAKQPLQYTGFAPNDPAALDTDTMAKVEANWTTNMGRYRGVVKPTNDLPEVQQKMVRNAIENHQLRASRGEKNLQPIVLDKVQVSVSTKMMYVLPNGNEADCDIYMSLSSFLPPPMSVSFDGKPLPSTDPVVLPPLLEWGGVVQVSPHSKDEVALILDAAKERGLHGVWIAVDGLDGKQIVSPELLAQAALMGKEKGVPVSAVVRLLLAPTVSDAAPEKNDRSNVTITGETGSQVAVIAARLPEPYPGANLWQNWYSPHADWLRPDAPLVPVLLKRRLLDVAQTPYLAGIVVKNAAAPGYEAKEPAPFGEGVGTDYGYTMENRVACLRAAHIDPVDFGGNEDYGEVNLSLPFFAEGQSGTWTEDGFKMDKKVAAPRTTWKTLRCDQNTQLLTGLFQAFRKEQPNLPLFIAGFDQYYRTGNVIAWEKADAIPLSAPYDYSNAENNLSEVAKAHKLSSLALLDVSCGRSMVPRAPYVADDGIAPGTSKAFARVVNGALKPVSDLKNAKPGSHLTWDGVILDFGEAPVAAVADLIRTGMAAPQNAKTTANR